MSITRSNPNTIHLGGSKTVVNDLAASEAITPGMLIERFNNAGIVRFRKNTQTDKAGSIYALDHSMANKGYTDDYAANDLVEAGIGVAGTTMWAIIGSGANIANGDFLGNAGNGKLKAVGSGVAIAIANETVNNAAGPGDARIRVEVV